MLALEYALRHPAHVSHLILMNPAPASAGDFALLRDAYVRAQGPDLDSQRAIMDGAAYREGEPAAVSARYRLHFKHALKESKDFDTLMERMTAAFISQGKEGIVKARAVEDRLMEDTWSREDYDPCPGSGTSASGLWFSTEITTSSRAKSLGTSRERCPMPPWSR